MNYYRPTRHTGYADETRPCAAAHTDPLLSVRVSQTSVHRGPSFKYKETRRGWSTGPTSVKSALPRSSAFTCYNTPNKVVGRINHATVHKGFLISRVHNRLARCYTDSAVFTSKGYADLGRFMHTAMRLQ